MVTSFVAHNNVLYPYRIMALVSIYMYCIIEKCIVAALNRDKQHTFTRTCFSWGVMYILLSCSLTHRVRTSASTSSYPSMVSRPSFNNNVILFWFAKNNERFCDSSIIDTSPVPRRRNVSALTKSRCTGYFNM